MTSREQPGKDGTGGEHSELEHLRARVAALETGRAARAAHHRWRSFFSALLIVLGCVLTPLAATASWAAAEVDDTDRYVATVAPLASDPAVQAAAANRVTDALMSHLPLRNLLEGVAPADRPRLEKALGTLATPLENAVRGFVHGKAQDVIASDTFQRFWVDANRGIHAAVDKALTGGGGAVRISNNSVTIDLAPVVDRVKQRLVDDGMTVAGRIPQIHTDLTVLRSDRLGELKTYLQLLRIAGFWLPVLAVLSLVVGWLLSVHRRRVLVAAVLGAAVAMLALGLGLTVFREVYLNGLPASVSQPAAGAVYDILTRYLRTSVRSVVALAVVIALAAWLTGRGRRATFVRQAWQSGIHAVRAAADHAGLRTGPVGPFVHRHRAWITWILVAAAVVTYILWSYPTGWVVLVIALVLLFAMAVVEFLTEPPAPPVPPAPPAPSTPVRGPGR
ncbi:hypothetical protein [Streptomyces kebangsaanensis]|uniref:hypothetical protein n=1 Tax=Streptomyces kebangsaanensis TaxID=864058 RepID=UPI00093C81D3|nr:hypothetical protein [Streptomyces kebangsaanensis]